MADLFRGMSQSNFLDGLVRATGLNGHELYDYLERLIAEQTPETISEEEAKEYLRPNPEYSFRGTRDEFYDFLELQGGQRYVASKVSGRRIDIFSSATMDALANYAANLLNVEKFYLTVSCKVKLSDGSIVEEDTLIIGTHNKVENS